MTPNAERPAHRRRLHRSRTRLDILILLAAALVGTSCSVSTPRDGWTGAAGSRQSAGGNSAAAGVGPGGGSVASGDTTAVDAGGAPAGGGPSGARAGPTSGAGRTAARQSGTGARSSVGVTAHSITFSLSGAFSGYGGPLTKRTVEAGLLPWIDDVNARGGIHGRKVIMTEVDNQTTAEGAVAACKEETGNGSLFAVLQSNFSSEADCVDKAGMPTLVLGGSEIVSKWRHVHVLTLGKDGATNAASFLKNSLGDGAKKIGLIYVKNAFDGERIKNAFVARTKALGVNVVDAEPIQQNQASFVGELQNLRAKGAETVVIYAVLEVLGILRDARALNYAPHWIGITWTVDTLSKAARNVMDGIHGVRLYATVNSPAYKPYLAMAQKYGQGNNADSSGMYWYGVGLLLDKVLRAAGPDLNRTTFNAAFDKIQNYSNNILAPLSWSRGQALGTRASWPVVCCNPDYTWKGFGRASTFG